uniref:SIGLEC family like 1 n=1 Tax=Rhinolophus ferrumequinum TaxID=59479 RepID=A0A671EJ18_RHIFE
PIPLGKSSLVPQTFIEGLFRGFVYGATAIVLLSFCLIPLMKHTKMKQAKKTAAIKSARSPEVRECQEPKRPLKPEEPEKSIITPSSESQILVGTHCVWKCVYQNIVTRPIRRGKQCLKEPSSSIL